MEKKYEEISQKLNKKIEEYKKIFANLNEQEKELVAYKKILELQFNETDEDLDKIYLLLVIIKESNFNAKILKSLLIFCSADEALDSNEQYQILKDRYTKVLKNYSVLANELHISSALELSHLFTYMLWNGYYSTTKNHCYSTKNRTTTINLTFLDIIKGSGVCLNYSECLENYLTICGKESTVLLCDVPKIRSIQRDYKPQIEQKYESNNIERLKIPIYSLLMRKILKFNANHAITLIKENGKFFAYDPTNLLLLNILNKNTGEIINGKGYFNLYPILTLCMTANLNSFPLLEEILKNNVSKTFNRKEIIFNFENTIEHIINNIPLLDDAYTNIHSELQAIITDYEKLKIKRKVKWF